MGYKVITAVAGDVIPLADLRLHLRLDMFAGATTHPDDAAIQSYLRDAREYVEHYTQCSIGEQTLELALDSFPDAGIELPLGAAEIISIKYTDAALVEQTIANNLYSLDDYSNKHWAWPIATWPAPAAVPNAVKIRYKTPSEIPAAGIQAMKLIVTDSYQNREGVNTDRGVSPIEMPLGIRSKLDTFRKWSL